MVTRPPDQLEVALAEYLNTTLRLGYAAEPWQGERGLPHAVRDPFAFRMATMSGVELLLALHRGGELPPMSRLEKALAVISEKAGRPVVLVAGRIESYERPRLIAARQAFIVPMQHLYVPQLGAVFREREASGGRLSAEAMAPATQHLLIAMLLDRNTQWDAPWNLAVLAARLGYTAMTASRAGRELVALGVLTETSKAERVPTRDRHETWEFAKPMMRSPVRRRGVTTSAIEQALILVTTQPPLAGLSALARHTLLAAPRHPTLALGRQAWKETEARGETMRPGTADDATLFELWAYEPTKLTEDGYVDRLSLVLSLRDDPDPRVVQAIEELELGL